VNFDYNIIANYLQQKDRMGTLVQQAKKRLHEQGGRLTAQRKIIFETLECLDCHPTAEELFEEVNQIDPNLNLSTVYRTLRWMETEGLVIARRFNEDRRQERFDPAYPTEHHHFLCSKCKQVIEFDDPKIEEIKLNFEKQTRCQIESSSMFLYGLCEKCRKQKNW
jgi:Fe2+ or Zn2+ uptake regulation protein